MKKRNGFTLVEILVVISITGLLVTIGIASYVQFNRRQVVDQAIKNLQSDLRYAQSKASMSDKGDPTTPDCTSSDPLVGWYFRITSATQYEIYGLCGVKPFMVKRVTLPSQLAINSLPSSILFKPLNLGTDASNTLITISGYDNSITRSLTVTSGGLINLNP